MYVLGYVFRILGKSQLLLLYKSQLNYNPRLESHKERNWFDLYSACFASKDKFNTIEYENSYAWVVDTPCEFLEKINRCLPLKGCKACTIQRAHSWAERRTAATIHLRSVRKKALHAVALRHISLATYPNARRPLLQITNELWMINYTLATCTNAAYTTWLNISCNHISLEANYLIV